jgi:hypothetical protein
MVDVTRQWRCIGSCNGKSRMQWPVFLRQLELPSQPNTWTVKSGAYATTYATSISTSATSASARRF